MKKLICALIGASALVASAATYIQTSPTGTAPWKPVKDSVSLAHLADSALHAPPSAYADSARASKISDSSKVLGNYARSSALHDTALTLRAYSAKTWADSASANSRHWIDSTGHVDSARIAWFAHAATYADSSRASGLADSAKRAGWAPLDSGRVRGIVGDTATALRTYIGSASVARADSSRASGISDTAKKAGTAANSLALGGIPAAGYGTLAQDTAIAKKAASDTATVLRTGIASAITTSEAYATARISDSLTANARAWTTLTAAKSSIHDTATALRTYIGSASTTGNAATSTKLATARTISMTGDGTWSTSFDGSANATGTLTLATLLTAGSAGSATAVPTLTWDAKGRLTAVGSAAISISHSQINDWSTATAGYLTTVLGDVASRGANIVYAGPNGSAGPATFRSLVYQDIPGYTRLFGNIDPNGFTIPQENVNAIGWNRTAGNGEFDFITNRTNLAGGFNWYSVLNGVWSTAMTLSSSGALYATASLSAPTIYESGTSLSSKYLGISASIPHTQISDWSTATSSFLTANQSISLTGAVTGSGTTTIATSFANTHLAGINQDLTTTSSPTFTTVTANLTGTASNASALGGVAADYFVQGTGYNSSATFGKRTTSFSYNGATPSSTALTDPLYSGFYDGYFAAGQTPNNSWAFVINTTHSDAASDKKFQFQIAAGFDNGQGSVSWGGENYWMRVINISGVGPWRTLIHSANVGSYALPITGGTVSGLITANGGISGNLTGHASLDLPLTGGTMTGNLLGGTPYNIGATSNWWGSIYATTIYESNVALSSKYLGISASIPHTQISDWGTYINQPLLTTSSPTFGQLRIGSVDNPLIRLVSDGSINVRAIAGHEFVVATPTDPSSSDGLSLRFSGSEGNPVAIKADAFYASGFYEGGVALSSKYLQANQPISLTGAVTGSGTTSIATSFANTHLAGIDQDLTTTSSPTFATVTANLTGTASNASALGGVAADYFVQGTGYNSSATFGKRTTSFSYNGATPSSTALTDPLYSGFYDGYFAAGQTPNNSWAFVINTTHSDAASDKKFQFQIAAGFDNGQGSVSWGGENYWMRVINISGVGPWRTLIHSANVGSYALPITGGTVSGLITANGGISGNLTGHASLDIPLTGSVAVTGSIQTTQGLYAASGMVGMYSMYDNIFTIGNNAHNIQVNNTTGETNFIGLTSVGMQGSLTVSGTFTPAVNLQSSIYTITRADQGKMVVSNNTLNLPSLTVHDAGFWCLVNWHVGGGSAVFGPTTSGTVWNLRGQVITVRTSMPFTGVVSWDGYNWYAG